MKNKYDFNDNEKLFNDNKLIFCKYNFNLDLIDTIHIPYNAKIGFNNDNKIKSNLLILYGFNDMVILRGKNSSDNKKENKMISELFE